MGSLLELIDESPKSRTADLFSVQEGFAAVCSCFALEFEDAHMSSCLSVRSLFVE